METFLTVTHLCRQKDKDLDAVTKDVVRLTGEINSLRSRNIGNRDNLLALVHSLGCAKPDEKVHAFRDGSLVYKDLLAQAEKRYGTIQQQQQLKQNQTSPCKTPSKSSAGTVSSSSKTPPAFSSSRSIQGMPKPSPIVAESSSSGGDGAKRKCVAA